MAKRNKRESDDTLHNTNGGVDVHELQQPPETNGTSDLATEPQPELPIQEPPETNGTSALATEPQPELPIQEPIVNVPKDDNPAVLRYQKAPSQVFYAVMGESRDGTVDCLGVTKTRGQAEKTLALLGMAVRRHYSSCNIWKCRPVDMD